MTRPSAFLRMLVRRRAGGQCEYCGFHEVNGLFPHQVDHIVASNDGGPTHAQNLALSCILCNRRKGSDASSDPRTGRVVRLYNPKCVRWGAHFAVRLGLITGLTAQGRATVSILRLNEPARLAERRA